MLTKHRSLEMSVAVSSSFFSKIEDEQKKRQTQGASVVGQNETANISFIRQGTPSWLVAELARELEIPEDELMKAIGLSRSTIKRYQAQDMALSPANSDVVYRVTAVFRRALDLFVNKQDALRWMKEPNPETNGVAPIALVDTTPGYELVMETISRIEHGMPA
jgi:putative toxin-antitoxin system antitoxin component (TIGR02293 family)